jgi:hypothetical protein
MKLNNEHLITVRVFACVFNDTFNDISVISDGQFYWFIWIINSHSLTLIIYGSFYNQIPKHRRHQLYIYIYY